MIWYFLPLYGPLVMALFVLKQPDMGDSGDDSALPPTSLRLGRTPLFEILLGVGGAIVTFAILVIAEPYRMDRVVVLWDPFSYAANRGYQTVQSLIAVGSGGLFGQSVGEGMSKFLYLPEQYTDFAYAVFSQEFGSLGSVFCPHSLPRFSSCRIRCSQKAEGDLCGSSRLRTHHADLRAGHRQYRDGHRLLSGHWDPCCPSSLMAGPRSS